MLAEKQEAACDRSFLAALLSFVVVATVLFFVRACRGAVPAAAMRGEARAAVRRGDPAAGDMRDALVSSPADRDRSANSHPALTLGAYGGAMALSAPPRGLLLTYPARALLVVAGIPGAGKSTLLRRLFPGSTPAATVLDPERIAVRWHHLPVPYRWYRPLVHTAHYLRAAVAIWRVPGAVVLHETGTRRIVRRLLAWLAALAGRPAYLLVIEAGLEEARHAQRRRGRELRPEPMLRHWRRWRRLRDRLAAGPGGLRSEGYRRAIVLTRADAARVDGIQFTERSPDEHQRDGS